MRERFAFRIWNTEQNGAFGSRAKLEVLQGQVIEAVAYAYNVN